MSETNTEINKTAGNESEVKAEKKTTKSESTEKYIAVVQVRGLAGVRAKVKDTLRMLGLTRVNQCVLVENNPSLTGMLVKVKDYTTYGPVKMDMVKKLVAARGLEYQGRLQDSKSKYTYSTFEYEGKKYKKCFRLNPPRKGFGRAGIKKGFTVGGTLGNRGEKITELIERMM
ncbi:50S ribosomal protein L30 [archaeon]|nr:50S ribosomal protein L30 [archaeon]|tara:strand:- start:825 stop:1340 length:516 start_codon:yes stop_codon:yes gene_type:complete